MLELNKKRKNGRGPKAGRKDKGVSFSVYPRL